MILGVGSLKASCYLLFASAPLVAHQNSDTPNAFATEHHRKKILVSFSWLEHKKNKTHNTPKMISRGLSFSGKEKGINPLIHCILRLFLQ